MGVGLRIQNVTRKIRTIKSDNFYTDEKEQAFKNFFMVKYKSTQTTDYRNEGALYSNYRIQKGRISTGNRKISNFSNEIQIPLKALHGFTYAPNSNVDFCIEKWRTEFKKDDVKKTVTETFNILLRNVGEVRICDVVVEEILNRAPEWTIDRTSHGLTSQVHY